MEILARPVEQGKQEVYLWSGYLLEQLYALRFALQPRDVDAIPVLAPLSYLCP